MKTSKYIFLVLTIGSIFIVSSCKKSFYSDVNKDPNTPTVIVPYVILSSVEGALGFTQSSTHCFFTSLFVQQTEGVSRQAQAYYEYIVTAQDLDDPFGNWYTAVMENDLQLMQLADSKGDSAYSGISRIIMAFALQQVVDAWGSTPYSQALKGRDNVHPSYDSDVSLYATINNLADAGISYLNYTNAGVDKPSQHGEDVIYNGSASKWKKFAHAIKARLAIHQSKYDVSMAGVALTEIASSFTSNGDNAQYKFGSAETAANARYQFNENRADMGYTSSTLANDMAANSDPRYQVLFDSTFNDVNGVGMGDYYGAPDAPAEFITYEELLYMKAEAELRQDSVANFAMAQTDFQSGIMASMDKLGVDAASDSTYLAAHGTLPASGAIAAVAYEAWISLFMNPEAWTEWRRTNSPALTPVVGNQIPRRFLYTQTELTFNGTNVPNSTLYSPKLFWDK